MCTEASFVLTKDRTFWSKTTDSHEGIISEYRLHADGAGGPNIVRVEVTPAGGDYTLPVDQWVYRVDQDDLPDWYEAAECEARVREALPAWVESKLVLPGETRNVKAGGYVARVYGTVQAVYDGGTVQAVYDGGTVQAVYDGGTVQDVRCGGTVQEVWNGGTVQKVWSGGTVEVVWNGGTVQKVWNGGTVQRVFGTVQKVYNGGLVEVVYGGGVVVAYTKLPDIRLMSPTAVLLDRSESGKVVMLTGK